MNTLQQALLALVSGYVVSEMFKLPYSECIYVACISAIVPLVLSSYKIKRKKKSNH